jgi:hypothetical protein
VATTAGDIYLSVCDVLLEPGGLTTGVYSEADFLTDFREVVADFFERCGIIKGVVTASLTAGNPFIAVPDYLMRVDHVLYRGKLLQQVTAGELDRMIPAWESHTGAIQYWQQDRVPLKHIGLYRIPAVSETNALQLVGPTKPSISSYGLSTVVTGLPDTLAPYLKYGMLDRVFGRDGETRDQMRQNYCRSRYEEGIAICRAIAEEIMEDVGVAAA